MSIQGINHFTTQPQTLIHLTLRLDASSFPGTTSPFNLKLYTMAGGVHQPYSIVFGAKDALAELLGSCGVELPAGIVNHVRHVSFGSSSPEEAVFHFPCPLKEQEATAAIKALEGCAVAAIADLRYGCSTTPRAVLVDMDKIACFLMSAYVTTVDGLGKGDALVKNKIPDTDLNHAQSNVYRRLSANLYATKDPGRYYHIHGSLEASTTLNMLGLPPHRPELTEYKECIQTIEKAVKRFTVTELEKLNNRHRQAGIEALKWDDFRRTRHGRALLYTPPFTVDCLEEVTPPVPFFSQAVDCSRPQVLQSIKVIELCRVIAGPTIGRSLAANGALVLKVTSRRLPDVPFFQLDVNTGKHTTSLDLKDDRDRTIFDVLLADADVLIDGYRPGALARLGYGPDHLTSIALSRGKGFVYVAEDCFGGTGILPFTNDPGGESGRHHGSAKFEWSSRPGWQQIADCATGVAWAQGTFMGLSEPVVPPFPMSDYGTGALGSVAALTALYNRAVHGGTWVCRTSLCQYDIFLQKLGLYPDHVQNAIRLAHAGGHLTDADGFFALRHADSVDEVGKRALACMRRASPRLFADEMMNEAWSEGFKGVVRWPKEAVKVDGVRIGHVRGSRPNGADQASWEGWEVDAEVAGQD